jgi:hypothetical protein
MHQHTHPTLVSVLVVFREFFGVKNQHQLLTQLLCFYRWKSKKRNGFLCFVLFFQPFTTPHIHHPSRWLAFHTDSFGNDLSNWIYKVAGVALAKPTSNILNLCAWPSNVQTDGPDRTLVLSQIYQESVEQNETSFGRRNFGIPSWATAENGKCSHPTTRLKFSILLHPTAWSKFSSFDPVLLVDIDEPAGC